MKNKMLFEKLGESAYIRNGIGFGFVSTEYLYNNKLLEIGIGEIISGYGDWGGGFSRAKSYALKISIDKNYIIKKVETKSYYNSPKESKKLSNIAKKLAKKVKQGSKLIITNKQLKEIIDSLFLVLPVKCHVGIDVFKNNSDMEYIVKNKDRYSYDIPDPMPDKEN